MATAKTTPVAKAKTKPGEYYENGKQLIYVIDVNGGDIEAEDCSTNGRGLMCQDDMEEWTLLERKGADGG